MPRFAANLSMLYPEHDFLDRFAAAAADGFTAVEYLFPYAHEAQVLTARLADHSLQQVLFNGPPGDWDRGERGLAALPGREDEFRRSIDKALQYAQALKCPRVHVMAGLAPAGAERAQLLATYQANLAWAARQAASASVNVLIEPINTRDIPGFVLNRQDEAHRIVQEVGAPNLKVQMDLYHCQIVEGDVAMKIRQYLPTGRRPHADCRRARASRARHRRDELRVSVRRDRRGVGVVRLGWLGRLRIPAAAWCGGWRYDGRAGLAADAPLGHWISAQSFPSAKRARTDTRNTG
jgi:hydroxypyruvate isomerase